MGESWTTIPNCCQSMDTMGCKSNISIHSSELRQSQKTRTKIHGVCCGWKSKSISSNEKRSRTKVSRQRSFQCEKLNAFRKMIKCWTKAYFWYIVKKCDEQANKIYISVEHWFIVCLVFTYNFQHKQILNWRLSVMEIKKNKITFWCGLKTEFQAI